MPSGTRTNVGSPTHLVDETPMPGKARRPRRAHRSLALSLRLEALEPRALLSGASLSGPSSSPADPPPSLIVGFKANASSSVASSAIRAVKGTVAESFPDGSQLVQL